MDMFEKLLSKEADRKSNALQTELQRLGDELKIIPLSPTTMGVRRQVELAVRLLQSVMTSQLEQHRLPEVADLREQVRYAMETALRFSIAPSVENDQLMNVLGEIVAVARALVRDHMQRHNIPRPTPEEQGFIIRAPILKPSDVGAIPYEAPVDRI